MQCVNGGQYSMYAALQRCKNSRGANVVKQRYDIKVTI